MNTINRAWSLPTSCTIVWQGPVLGKLFSGFAHRWASIKLAPTATNWWNKRPMISFSVQSSIKTASLSTRLNVRTNKETNRRDGVLWVSKGTCLYRLLYYTRLLRVKDVSECIMQRYHWQTYQTYRLSIWTRALLLFTGPDLRLLAHFWTRVTLSQCKISCSCNCKASVELKLVLHRWQVKTSQSVSCQRSFRT